jgi:hypothetical protein
MFSSSISAFIVRRQPHRRHNQQMYVVVLHIVGSNVVVQCESQIGRHASRQKLNGAS